MQRILLAGKTGQVGWELQTALAPLGTIVAFDQDQMDFAHPDQIRRAIRETKPAIIVNAAAYTAVDKAESEPDLALQVNGIAPGVMAEEAKRLGAVLVHYSTDYIFDGTKKQPYVEDDPPNPLSQYGRTKLAGERAIEAVGGKHLILRSSWVYSARGSNFVLTMLRLAREKPELSMVDDQSGSPTWARALAEATAALLRRKELIADHGGIYHLAASGHATRYEFAKAIIALARELSGPAGGWASVRAITSEQYPLPARRPRAPILSGAKVRRAFGVEMPRWEEQLRAFLSLFPKGAPPVGGR